MWDSQFALFAVLCTILFVLSIACRSLDKFIRHDLERLCNRKNRKEYFAAIVEKDESVGLGLEMLRAVLLVAIPIVGIGGIWGGETTWTEFWSVKKILPIVSCCFAYVGSLYWLSRPLADLYATRIVYYGFPVFRLLSWLALPLCWLDRFFEIIIFRLAGIPEAEIKEEDSIEDEIRSIVTDGHRDGFIENDAREMIERIMQLDESSVTTIMTPRTDISSISRDASWDDMLQIVNETQLSRIPVWGENRDDIIGILFSKDLLPNLGTDGNFPPEEWTQHLHAPYFVPETKQIHILLREFLQTHNHFAVVLDEYGGVTGIVTLEDILEEIVGEITDETDDAPTEEITLLPDGNAEVLGRAHIDEINTRLEIDLPEDDDYETIGGLILTRLGRVPEPGEEMEFDGNIRVTILDATLRTIEKVRVERGASPTGNSAS